MLFIFKFLSSRQTVCQVYQELNDIFNETTAKKTELILLSWIIVIKVKWKHAINISVYPLRNASDHLVRKRTHVHLNRPSQVYDFGITLSLQHVLVISANCQLSLFGNEPMNMNTEVLLSLFLCRHLNPNPVLLFVILFIVFICFVL